MRPAPVGRSRSDSGSLVRPHERFMGRYGVAASPRDGRSEVVANASGADRALQVPGLGRSRLKCREGLSLREAPAWRSVPQGPSRSP